MKTIRHRARVRKDDICIPVEINGGRLFRREEAKSRLTDLVECQGLGQVLALLAEICDRKAASAYDPAGANIYGAAADRLAAMVTQVSNDEPDPREPKT